MTRRKIYICAGIILVLLVAGIVSFRVQGKKNEGKLGKEIVYFGETKEEKKESAAEPTAAAEVKTVPEETASGDMASKDTEQKDSRQTAVSEPEETKEPYPVIKSDEKMKVYDSTGTVVIGNTGYELYNYVDSSASRYTKAVNKLTKKLDASINVYDIVIPTSAGITFPDNLVGKINNSSQKEALQKIKKKLSGREKFISLYDTMMRHRNEYIYFRTDHHWTQLGAYYAYVTFCEHKGMEANPLSAYQKKVVKDFLGTIYVDSNQDQSLKKDDLEIYYPVSQHLTMKYKMKDGRTAEGPVISDPTNYGISSKYSAFIDGDNPYSVIINKDKRDGSSCIVVKESFGNAFVPFLADHYAKIYVIDYRYWDGNLAEFVKKRRAKEVILLNNISMTRNAYLIGMLSKIL